MFINILGASLEQLKKGEQSQVFPKGQCTEMQDMEFTKISSMLKKNQSEYECLQYPSLRNLKEP